MHHIRRNAVAEIVRDDEGISQVDQYPFERERLAGCLFVGGDGVVRHKDIAFELPISR